MKVDPVKQYKALRASLLAERNRLQTRLAALNEALEQTAPAAAAVSTGKPGRPPGVKRAANALSLRQAVAQALKSAALTKPDLLAAIQNAGYKFTARDPMNSLNTLLYTPGNFKKLAGGKWGLLKK